MPDLIIGGANGLSSFFFADRIDIGTILLLIGLLPVIALVITGLIHVICSRRCGSEPGSPRCETCSHRLVCRKQHSAARQ